MPRTPDELQKIETLVKSAIGFNPDRGDQLSVQNIPFQDTDEAGSSEVATWWTNPFFTSLAKNLMIGVGFLVLILFVIRPLLASLRLVRRPTLESFDAIGADGALLTTADRELINSQMAEQLNLIEQAKKDPYQVAQILQNWVSEDK